MFGTQFVVLALGFFAFNFKHVHSLTDAEKQNIMAMLMPFISECSKDYPITAETMENIAKTGHFDSLNPCFSACVLKKIGLMDDQGMLDEKKAVEYSKQYFSSEDQAKVPDALAACKGVNEKPVGDGVMGCDRVKLLIDCGLTFVSSIFTK